jgi:hypothetical protein
VSDAGIFGALVGLAVAVIVAFIQRNTALETQRAAERATALLRVVQLVELHGQSRQNSVFNDTIARPPEASNRYSEPEYDLYGPRRRNVRETSLEELSEIASLLAAYGSPAMDGAYEAWTGALQGIADAYVASEPAYWEEGQRAQAGAFASSVRAEQDARLELGRLIRATLTGSRYRRLR